MVNSLIKAKPQWISEAYKAIGGQDHLGLGSVSSDQILENLSPGLIALTPHPRYCSFYTFLLDEFWNRNLNRNQSTWIKFFRPRAFIFSLGAHFCSNPEHNNLQKIMGSRTTGKLSRQNKESYNTDFDYIKNKLGGYGLYYGPLIRKLGWVVPSGQPPLPPVDAPTPEGKRVSELFRKTIEDTEYYKSYFDTDIIDIPRNVIEDYIKKACLCQLQKKNSIERNYSLYHFIENHDDLNAISRRKTFMFFLDLINKIQNTAITDDIFRQIIYFKTTINSNEYEPDPGVRDNYYKWRLYQAREYYGFALNSMWFYLCNWGSKKSNFIPIEVEEFWTHISKELNLKNFSNLSNTPVSSLKHNSKFADLLNWIKNLNSISKNFDAECNINDPINEYKLYNLVKSNNESLEFTVFGTLIILSLIYLRFEIIPPELKDLWFISKMGGRERLSLDYFIKSLKKKLNNKDITIIEVIKWIFLEFVIEQHIKIASNKLPQNTFRFIKEGNKIVFFDIENSDTDFNTSRFEAISTTIHELGLCSNFNETQHNLTHDGLTIVNGDLPKWNI